MGSKLDQKWAGGIIENVNALISEVMRLEGIIERVEQTLDPNWSPGGDIEWFAKNHMRNVNEMMIELEQLRAAARVIKLDGDV